MGIWNWLFPEPDGDVEHDHETTATPAVNPATGLPMMGEHLDVMGNPYGFGNPGGAIGTDDHMDSVHSSDHTFGSSFDDFT
jgi:hypothetical protein